MNLNGILFCLLLLPSVVVATPQYEHTHFKRYRPKEAQKGYYELSNKIFIKYFPTSLFSITGEKEIRLGAEYCFNRNTGISLDAGYIIASGVQNNSENYIGNGFAIRPQIRYYVVNKDVGTRFFIGLQGIYKVVNYSGLANGRIIDKYFAHEITQTGGRKSLFGANVATGFVLRLWGGLHLDLSAGMGLKQITWQRENLQIGTSYHAYNSFLRTENQVKDDGTNIFFTGGIGISWILGRHPNFEKRRRPGMHHNR